MELSAILPIAGMGGDQSRCLNDDFAAQTPSGDNVFNRPVADKTVFKTPQGTLVASYLFDPTQEYGERSILASITTDFMSEMRDAVTKVLLEEKDIAPKQKTYEETLWDNLISNIPKEALAKTIFNDEKKLAQYSDLITKAVDASFREEEAMTESLKSKDFSFSFQVAVDHYPGKHQDVNSNTSEKKGVLTFHLRGQKQDVVATASKSANEQKPKTEKKEPEEKETKSKKRKYTSTEASRAKKGKEARDELLSELGLLESYNNVSETVHEKVFPITATQFFDSLGKWFTASVSNRASKLEKQRANVIYQ